MEALSNNWLYIEPYVHLEIVENEILLFNTLNNSLAIFSEKVCYKLFKEIQKQNNLRVISLTDNLINKPKIISMLQTILKNYMGDILISETLHFKPVQLTPLLKIEEHIPDPRKEESSIISNNISTFVNEFNVFINNDKCHEDHSFLEHAFKQHLTVKKDHDKYIELGFDTIMESINSFSKHNLSEVNVLGCNIFEHSNISELIKFLNGHSFWKNYHINFRDFSLKYLDYINVFDNKTTLHLSFNNIINETELIVDTIKKTIQIPNIEYNFFIYSDTCIEIVENLYSKLKFSNNYRLFPYFNGSNLEFLESNVYFSKREVSESDIGMKDILLRKKLNVLLFGRLYLNSDGKVYSNLNFQPLGNIYENSILKMIFKEVNQVKSWSFLRKNVSPCNNCLYKNLCPPISNLELYMKKFNFCIN